MDELLSRKMGCSFYFIAVLVSAAEDQRQMSKTTLLLPSSCSAGAYGKVSIGSNQGWF